MSKQNLSRYGYDISDLIKLPKISNEQLTEALKNPYNSYYISKNGKKRLIEEPNSAIIPYLRVICKLLRQVRCPPYNFAGYELQNAYLNAKAHVGQFAFLTTDISHYFTNSKDSHVLNFLTDELFIRRDDELEFLMKLLTFNGHIPTGAPTSTILAFLCHKKLFDKIYDKMQALKILFTLYVDDITLSAQHGITNDVFYCIKDILAEHGLSIKANKTKRYSYKKALITGFYVHQSGKITVPDKIGHSVIKKLKAKSINDMSMTECRKLIGKINYIQFCNKKAFNTTKIKAYKQIDKLMQEENNKRKEK